MNAPVPVAVKAWGELRGERNLPGALHILVAGQHAGGAERVGGEWLAFAGYAERPTVHATAGEAVGAVLKSSWARKLGARKASRVYWSDKATRRAGGAR
jgi:hypothetical protein